MTDALQAAALSRAPTQLLWTVRQSREALNVSHATIYVLIRKGLLAPIKVGRATRFRAADVIALAERGTGG